MKLFQRHILTSSVIAIVLTACQTLPAQNAQETSGAQATQTSNATASTPKTAGPVSELINQSEVIATVKSKAVAVDLERQALEWGYTLKKRERLEGLNVFLLTFDCPPGVKPKEAALELERLQPKSSVGALQKYTMNSSNIQSVSPKAPKTFANEMLQWPETACETPVKIGLIDGGVSKTFSEETTANLHQASFIDSPASEGAIMHGTSIAAILADPDRLKGVELYSAAVVDQDESGNEYSSPTAILKALNWMVLNDVKVVNISLSGPPNKVLETALDAASEKGLITVAAVGNQGRNSAPQFPAAYENVLAATAVDVQGEIYDKAVRGSHVDFSAPGVDIYISSAGQGKYISGTSIAAPFVTAAIASSASLTDYKSRNDVIRYFANHATDLGPKGKDRTFGLGLINAKHICKTG